MNHLNARIAAEVVTVEGQNLRDSMNDHGRYQTRIVSLLA